MLLATLCFIFGVLGLISPKITIKFGFLKSRAGIFGFYILFAILFLTISMVAMMSGLDIGDMSEVVREARIAHLDSIVRTIPASNAKRNLNAYEELLALDPDNARYQRKVKRYRSELGNSQQSKPSSGQPMNLPEDLAYNILRDDRTLDIKRSVEVRIDERLTREQIEVLARKVKASDKTQYERTFIFYLLPHEVSGEGCYATSHYDPNLEVVVHGVSQSEFEKLRAKTQESDNREVIGVWFNDEPMFTCRITLYRENGNVYVESKYKDFDLVAEVREVSTKAGVVYDNVKNPDVYRVSKTGDLQLLEALEGDVYEEYSRIE